MVWTRLKTSPFALSEPSYLAVKTQLLKISSPPYYGRSILYALAIIEILY